ncbi:P-loop containing nucleoside triphosphate hydrolase protein [Aspergillus minisclerotigenes]|uniref:P-loop containing nucleoside triphosphate hydrolase protein n=1 Tax=Aspergillus minisclerotigenes TaxID=656917 RepID=A0A5N6IMN0_9EURO|nr:P-loop containing nucleoside triphosphate hydrolase protein [Aspergillus minisclerotigenes]
MRSATIGLPNSRETVVALDADHESICRFASEDDDDYRRVSSLIVELAASVTEPSLRSFSTSGSTYVAEKVNANFFILPYSRNPGFVGRGPILESLGVCLASFGMLPNRIALYGLGGVGKSHVAIEFAYRFTTEHPEASIFWVHASSIDRFKQGYCDILDACGVFPEVDNRDSDRPMRVREWLEKQHREWLLIIDNADEASLLTSEGNIKGGKLGTATQAHKHLSILDYLPDCPHGSIIITTRDRVTGVRFTKSCAQNLIEVVSMTEAESASLIKSTATEQCLEDSEVDELAELLEHLPLAIVQAMTFIQENALTVGEYIELYNDSDETRIDLSMRTI